MYPKPETKSLRILEVIADICPKTIDKNAPFYDIYMVVGGPRESLRSLLNLLKRGGLISNPVLGRYKLTEEGEKRLSE